MRPRVLPIRNGPWLAPVSRALPVLQASTGSYSKYAVRTICNRELYGDWFQSNFQYEIQHRPTVMCRQARVKSSTKK